MVIWRESHRRSIAAAEKSRTGSGQHGGRRRISERGRGGGAVVPVALRAAAGAALSLLHGRRLGRRFPRRAANAAARRGARIALVAASIAFVLGFTTVFVALGAGASTIGRFLRVWQEPLAIGAGIVIILMGLNFLGVIRIPLLSREARFQAQGKPASARRRLCHGAGLRLRLDALHRPGARADPDAGRRPRDGGRGRAAACSPIRSGSAFRS